MVAESIKPKTRKRKVDVLTAIEHKQSGLSYRDIAAIQKVTPQAIQQAIRNLLPTQHTEQYKEHRADILANLQLKYINNIDDAQIKKNLSQRGMTDLAILYDKERLERGMSTANLLSVHADIQAMRRLRADKGSIDT
jgi:predicted transcriptional regulator